MTRSLLLGVRPGARSDRSIWAAAVPLAVLLLASGIPVASAQAQEALDCAGDLGNPVPGTEAWDMADLNNFRCAAEGLRLLITENPAVAAATQSNVQAGDTAYMGDPFRAPNRWKDQRGRYQVTSFTDRTGTELSAVLLGPLDRQGGPYPGVIVVCHICLLQPTAEGLSTWYWAAESLAEAGYVVMYYANKGNAPESAVDAIDFFVATPDAPARGSFNPWHAQLDRSRLGIIGHSGAGAVTLNVGQTDPRIDAIVAWDPASSSNLGSGTPRTPTMIQVADYSLAQGPVRRSGPPTPEVPRYFFFDQLSAAGVDSMQVAVRAATHLDWAHFPPDPTRPHGIFGEMVDLYYTLAWLDRYLAPARVPGAPLSAVQASKRPTELLSRDVASDALRRLTDTGTDRFDASADLYSIGTGFFDPEAAQKAGNVEAGNIPITISGIPVRNLLSFQFPSKFFLEGGKLQCLDMRSGCPRPGALSTAKSSLP